MRITDGEKQLVSDRAAEWVLILDNNPSPQTKSRFQEWVTESPQHMEEFLLASAAFEAFEEVAAIQRNLTHALDLANPPDNRLASDKPLVFKARAGIRALTHRPFRVVAALAGIAALGLMLQHHEGPVGHGRVYSEAGRYSLGNTSFMRLGNEPRAVTHPFEGNLGVQVILLKGAAEFWGTHFGENSLQVFAGHTFMDALGTNFDVRRESAMTVVAVKDGKVRLRSDCESIADANADRIIIPGGAGLREIVLGPGQSAVIEDQECAGPSQPKGETPPPAQHNATSAPAWLTFEETTVKDAVAAFNRWNVSHLVVSDPVLANRRVDGRFRTSDPETFVTALTQRWGARVTRARGVDGTLTINLCAPERK